MHFYLFINIVIIPERYDIVDSPLTKYALWISAKFLQLKNIYREYVNNTDGGSNFRDRG